MEVQNSQGSGWLKQAVSGNVAFGQGQADSPIVCDGTPHANSYRIWVETFSPAPFRQGDATVDLWANACGSNGCQYGQSGPRVIRLKK